MSPLLDEKLVLTLLRIIPEYIEENFELKARPEAFGPSRNEGLCYEHCSAIRLSGQPASTLYFGLDGYTKLELLPRLAPYYLEERKYDENQDEDQDEDQASAILLNFSQDICQSFLDELSVDESSRTMESCEDLSHKLTALDSKKVRQYILIFFLTEPEKKRYLGRLYLVFTLDKF